MASVRSTGGSDFLCRDILQSPQHLQVWCPPPPAPLLAFLPRRTWSSLFCDSPRKHRGNRAVSLGRVWVVCWPWGTGAPGGPLCRR